MPPIHGSISATRSLLDFDPDLGASIERVEWPRARAAFTGELITVPAGAWSPIAGRDSLGFLIIDGVVCRELSLVDRRSLELLGGGDVVQAPSALGWPQLSEGTMLTAIIDAVVFELGPTFARAAARWPGVLAAVMRRIDAQRERLAIQGLVAHVPRAEHRLLLALWHLAARWGRVTAEGTVIPLALSHDLIGQLIAARRSTATLAISRAEQDGLLARRSDGTWLLTAEAEQQASSLASARAVRSNAQMLMIRQRSSELLAASRAVMASVEQDRRARASAERPRHVSLPYSEDLRS
ncbi:MAG TPA: hypothetical protein VG223_03310 [Solirubrobacteraceae bacterium]|jgi:hypothetical protein|nr:hypothetical protein [Solirubrobacteraceae bacterium]